jgi:hypothetical protein
MSTPRAAQTRPRGVPSKATARNQPVIGFGWPIRLTLATFRNWPVTMEVERGTWSAAHGAHGL